MKKFTFLAFLVLFVSAALNNVVAQKMPGMGAASLRCATMERLAIDQQNYAPSQRTSPDPLNNSQRDNSTQRTQAIVYVPVVIHIVLPNPFAITDADVQGQIDRLNLDFSGLNPDSANASNFFGVRGHSQIQFCLARRTPGGQLTNGIERRASNTGSNISLATDPIKRTASGGLDAWDASQYLNIWVGNDVSGFNLLGYAQFPGTGSPANDGVFTYFGGFGSSSCYTIPQYNKGRTTTHEVGHYFGLLHIWGDENGCAGDDFRNLNDPAIGSSVVLPASLANAAGQANTPTDVGDTPNQAGPTTNCPSGVATDACSPAAPGKMYQNQMDYSFDACLTLFTNKQVARMEWILDNARAGLKTSFGCQLPTGAITLDAAPASSVNPGGFEQVGCNFINYPATLSCPGNLTPKFRVVNNGLNVITSLTVGYRYDNGAAVSQTINVNIPSGGTYVHTFSSSVAAVIGSHSFKFFTSNPNGSADQVPANDTLTQALTVLGPVAAPIVEGFESTTFPPGNWTIVNPNGDFTWQRTTPGRNGSLGKMSINNYTVNATGNVDDFRSQAISVDPAKIYTVSFDIAHKNYPGSNDVLSILVSGDCGQTFTQIYSAGGAALATAGSSTAAYTAPAAADWATRVISIPASALVSGQIQVVFRNRTDFGNWIHIDNINISPLENRDLKIVSINNPGPTACSPAIKPSITVQNVGFETITSFNIGFSLNNGTNIIETITQSLAPNATATVTFAGTANAGLGNNTIKAFTASPTSASGTGDAQNSNDTLSKPFVLVSLITPPVVEGFETSFPPSGWTIFNPNNNVTWIRRTPGRASVYSAFIDNFNNNLVGQIDEIRIPFLNVAGADSVIMTFDLAHKNYAGANDRLQVFSSTDCGNTFTSVYNKAGATLATAGASTANYVAPAPTDWRTERVALGATATATGSIGLSIRNTNAYGNNIFIDNINIVSLFKRDLQLVSINQPSSLLCSNTVTPSVTVRNAGIETVTAFKVSYSINNGTAVTQTISSVSLARNTQMNVVLPVSNVAGPGSYNLRIYSWEPVTVSGTGDLHTVNDTLSKAFSVAGTVSAPLTESFVGTSFPPANWSVLNPDGNLTWSRFPTGNGNPGSAYVNSFVYQATGQTDDLVSPIITYSGVDSVRLTFDVAAATKNYPGATAIPIDTLEVLVTRDCGNTFTSIYKKWGNELQTVDNPNDPQTTEFVPTTKGQWRTENIDMTQFAAQSPLILFFRLSNNFENNIFIDNVNLTTRTLPALLKQQGYLVLPTAFNNSFTIWHYQTPTTVKYVNVVNSVGQRIWSKQFNGNADKQVAVDLTGKSAGVYFVEIGYEDRNRNVVQKVVKY